MMTADGGLGRPARRGKSTMGLDLALVPESSHNAQCGFTGAAYWVRYPEGSTPLLGRSQ